MTIQESNIRIIELLAEGKTVKEIASCLDLSKTTVDKRIRTMRMIEGCRTVTQLVAKMANPVFDRMQGSG